MKGWLSFFFFFSSRRRHTRFDCDWSSDVCSSDLYPTVRHLALDRRRRRRPGVDVDDLAEVLPAPAGPTGTSRELLRAVNALPRPQREVVVMRFGDDLSLQQIADASGIPLGTVKSRLHHALVAMRRALGSK